MILQLLELIFPVFLCWLVWTQLAWPMLMNTKCFPLFRREKKIQNQILDANQAIHEKDLEAELGSKINEVRKDNL